MNYKMLILPAILLCAACSNEKKESAAYSAGGLYSEIALMEECSKRFSSLGLDIQGAKDALKNDLKKTNDYFIAIDETKWLEFAKEDGEKRVKQEADRGTFSEEYCTNKIDETIKNGPPERIKIELAKF